MMTRVLFLLFTLCALLSAQRIDQATMDAVAKMPVQDAVAGGEKVEVRDAGSGEPVPGAEVLVMSEPKDEATVQQYRELVEKLQASGLSREQVRAQMVATYATRYRTGDDGTVTVAAPGDDRVRVFAYHGKRQGTGYAGTPVRIAAPTAITVRVVDWRGRPAAGVPVRVGPEGDHWFHDGAGVTQKDGTCRIELNRRRARPKMVAILGVLMSEPPSAPFDGRSPPAEPLQLQLPKLGKVRFILYGEDERPSEQLTAASLRLPGRQRLPAGSAATSIEKDSAMFDYVELGRELVVSASLEGTDRQIEFRGKGPTMAGELTIIEGRINTSSPLVDVRVLGLDGAPIADERLHLVYRYDNSYSFHSARTDANGRLRLAIQRQPDVLYVLRRADTELTSFQGTARIALGELHPGRQRLDDVRLQREPVVARGRVVDSQGAPVAGLRLQTKLSIVTAGNGGGSRSGRYDPFQLRVRTDDEGRFELRELHPTNDSYDVRFQHEQLIAPEGKFTVQRGGKSERHVAVRMSSVVGTVEPGLDGVNLPLYLENTDNQQRHYLQTEQDTFRSANLPPGTYDLVLGQDRDEARIKGIVAPPGGRAEDVRLSRVAWSEHFQRAQVRVLDDQGKPIVGATVWVYTYRNDGKGRSGSGASTDEHGRCQLLARRKDCDIAVEAKGYAAVGKLKPKAQMLVHLSELAPVTLQIKGLPKLPRGIYLQVLCKQQAPANGRFARAESHRTASDRVKLTLPTLGEWQAKLSLRLDYTAFDDRDRMRDAKAKLMRLRMPEATVEVTNKAKDATVFELDEAEVAAIQECLDAVRKILAGDGR